MKRIIRMRIKALSVPKLKNDEKATIMKGRLDTAIEERKGLLKEIEKVVSVNN